MSFVVGLSLALIRAFVALITALAVLVGVVVVAAFQLVGVVIVAGFEAVGERQRKRPRARTQRLTRRPVPTYPPPDPATRVNPRTGELR